MSSTERTHNRSVPGNFYKQHRNKFIFHAANAALEVKVLNDKIIKFRYSQDGDFAPDFSYATNNANVSALGFLNFEENTEYYIIYTFFIHCYIKKNDLKVSLYNTKHEIIVDDNEGYSFEENKEFGGYNIYCEKLIQNDEVFFGLGDKPTELNLKGRRFTNWCADTPAFQKDQDPLYKTIPFYTGLHHGIAYGIFFDNTFKSFFDFGLNESDTTCFWAEGGEMAYYFIYGPELIEVTSQYTLLTGTAQLPPLWSLGYQQCKWSYFPDTKVEEIAETFRLHQIPCDAIYLDIDYMDKYKCFTWHPEHFPDPKTLVNNLKNKGFKTVIIIDPGIKIEKGYPIYDEAKASDYFCKRADGALMRGTVWPGACNFPDFTDPSVRVWWGHLFKELQEIGIEGFWNDMNEPAVFETGTFPLDVRHMYEGMLCSHRKAHNVYGMLMTRSTYEGVKTIEPNKRKLVISRAGYSGSQRYGAVWTGDNMSTWEHLWIANIQCQRLASSGISFCGSDVGGFIGKPNGELFARWTQMAIFHPFLRAHATSEYGDKEPWAYGENYIKIIKKSIELRYQLLPYIYTCFWQYVNQGKPMIRTLVMMDQQNPDTYYRMEEFSLGDHILTCPIGSEGALGRYLYLPQGDWYYFYNDQLHEGRKEYWIETNIDCSPIFIKAGAVIPFFPVQQYVGEKNITELELNVYFNQKTQTVNSQIFEDDYSTYNYENGAFKLRNFISNLNVDKYEIKQEITGNYISTIKKLKIKLRGFPNVETIYVDSNQTNFNIENNCYIFDCHENVSQISILLTL
jgi:alpha-glucosidase